MITRCQARKMMQENVIIGPQTKRKAESPPQQRKRSAFGDITNALRNVQISSNKKSQLPVPTKKVETKPRNRSLGRIVEKQEDSEIEIEERNGSSLPNSQNIVREDVAAINENENVSPLFNEKVSLFVESEVRKNLESEEESPELEISYDYDKENEFDPFNVPHFARDIFDYYKEREPQFYVDDYLTRQNGITKSMRAVLVDWMVEVQENFELNHETLYQAVKMTDLFLNTKSVTKQVLQLVGTTALFISAKFDERCPPASDDFLYICDDAYTRKELLAMEREILKQLQFDIGFPLSYRFLRRYAKVSKTSMETLTLARYVLEWSLMIYELVHCSDSLIAAASLLLALKMKNEGDWTPVHRKYSGYAKEDVEQMMWKLHKCLKYSPLYVRSLQNIKTKYSHDIFFKVATVNLLDDDGPSLPLFPPDTV